jgi:purine-cytosine permease-like protein
MTDVPPDRGDAGFSPEPPSELPVVRRSNFTPPPPDADPPIFDDDALADALAAEVATYTSPIKLPAPVEPPPVPEPETPAPAREAGVDEQLATPEVMPSSAATEGPSAAAASVAPVMPPAAAAIPDEEDLFRALSGTSTLEAMELLENALKRLSSGEQFAFDPPTTSAPVEVAPVQVAPVDASPVDASPVDASPVVADPIVPAPIDPAPIDRAPSEPSPGFTPSLPGSDDLGWNQVSRSSPEPEVAPAEVELITTERPVIAVEPPPAQEPASAPAASTAASTATGEALAWLFPPATSTPAPEPAPAPEPEPAPAAPAAAPVPEAPPAAFLVPPELGPQFVTPVPYSTEPPVGPESPDWLDAPPPAFSPPPLIEPPAFLDTRPTAALDPVAPITASTMSRLPLPLPTELPNIAERAELPPPPGYDNDPIASATPFATEVSESALQSVGLLEHDDDDVIDAVDRVAGTAAVPMPAVGAAEMLAPPSEPVATVRLNDGEPAIVDHTPRTPSAVDVESAGLEPTALDLRAGRAARLFWLWFAANSSVVSVGLGAILLGTGMSLRQAIVATLAGVALSFLPLGLGTLAGKWSGQPTMVVSRATFGHAGNLLPAVLAVITRVFWGGALLWLLATAVARALVGAGLDAGLGTTVWQLVVLVVGFVIATVVAVFGYGLVARLQLVLSIVTALLIVGLIVITYPHLNISQALGIADGPWLLVVPGAVLVFSVIGLAWVHSSSDLARYQRPASSGGASMLWATFGATLPPFALIVWGALLAASDRSLASELQTNPLAAIASLLPNWYPAPLLAASGLGLLSAVVLTIYSGGFALQALGVRTRRSMGALVSALLVLLIAAALLFVVVDFGALVRGIVITLAVPVSAWAGIFASEMMIRTRRFHAPSLLAPGGIYPQIRIANFLALILVSAIGYGLITTTVEGLGWQGFLFPLIGIARGSLLASSDLGVLVALVLGLLVPIIGGIPAIRRQEHASLSEPDAIPATAGPLVD